jgi:hypothetical protein
VATCSAPVVTCNCPPVVTCNYSTCAVAARCDACGQYGCGSCQEECDDDCDD